MTKKILYYLLVSFALVACGVEPGNKKQMRIPIKYLQTLRIDFR